MTSWDAAYKELEPPAKAYGDHEFAVQLSQAISLRRIADALEKQNTLTEKLINPPKPEPKLRYLGEIPL